MLEETSQGVSPRLYRPAQAGDEKARMSAIQNSRIRLYQISLCTCGEYSGVLEHETNESDDVEAGEG